MAPRLLSISERSGGLLLLIASVVALVWANTSETAYQRFIGFEFGPASLHLNLSVSHWAGDGLLAVFFLVAGIEVKREMVTGSLSSFRSGAVPIAAAVGGVIVPAIIFVLFNVGNDEGALRGWAIASATDIAFAVAILALVGAHLPRSVRTFLLTLAVVDDLLAITIIAVFYASGFELTPFVLAILALGLFGYCVRQFPKWWLLVPLGLLIWGLVHASGIHATVAGVLLAFVLPVRAPRPDTKSLAERVEHWLAPVSAAVCLPFFALVSAGVFVGGWSGLSDSLANQIGLGVIAGLVVGKPLGILLFTWTATRLTKRRVGDDLPWIDIVGLSLLGGVGFTVSILIGELAYDAGGAQASAAKVGVLMGSALAAALGAAVLGARNRRYRQQLGADVFPENVD